MGWLVLQLVSPLVSSLVSQWVSWFIGPLVPWLIGQLVGASVVLLLVGWSLVPSVGWPSTWSVLRWVCLSICPLPFGQLVCSFVGLSVPCVQLAPWLLGHWSLGWSVSQSRSVSPLVGWSLTLLVPYLVWSLGQPLVPGLAGPSFPSFLNRLILQSVVGPLVGWSLSWSLTQSVGALVDWSFLLVR